MMVKNGRDPYFYFLLAAYSAVFVGVCVVQELLISPNKEFFVMGCWNAIRLAWTGSILLGEPMYPFQDGPVLSQMYGPVGPLVYIPAFVFESINQVIIAGALISAVLYFFPAALPFLPQGKGALKKFNLTSPGCFVLFCLVTVSSRALSYSAFAVHADAPALGFGALACWFVCSRKQRGQTASLAASVFFLTLSIMAKQTFLPLFFAVPFYLGLAEGFKKAASYALSSLCALALALALTVTFVDSQGLIQNTVSIPLRTPWIMADRGLALWEVTGELLEKSFLLWISMLWCWLVASYDSACFTQGPFSLKRWIKDHPWLVYLIAAVFLVPASVLTRVKWGGALNAFSPTLYFLAIALCLNLSECAGAGLTKYSDTVRRKAVLLWCLLTVGLLITRFHEVRNFKEIFQDLAQSDHVLAYEFARKNPGRAYFPNNPLSTILAEGKAYHCIFGLNDWKKAGFAPEPEHFANFVPAQMKYIIFPQRSRWETEFVFGRFPQYSDGAVLEGFPNALVFQKEDARP
ncbi:MAG TPA: hypothetical protein P5160_03415 [Candidatus Omnitrophota bacterium]|nr:hypothetical protein [Candidatus Omnitrophota bacterium]